MRFLAFLAQRLRGTQTEFLIENMQPSWLQNHGQRLIYRLIYKLIVWLFPGLIFGFFFGFVLLNLGLIAGLILLLDDVLNYGLNLRKESIYPIEVIKFSLIPRVLNKLIKNLFLSLIFGLYVGLILGLFVGQTEGEEVIGILIVGLIFGLIFGMIFGLIFQMIEVIKGEITNKSIPNQGIRNSAKNMIFLVILFSLIFFLVQIGLKPFLLKLATAKVSIITNAFQGLVFYFAFISGGGFACIQHFFLRLVLWYNRYIPWNYAKFLSRAAERRFIQQIGGRYRFIHRLLLEHFAHMRV